MPGADVVAETVPWLTGGVVHPTERDVQRVRILGLTMLPMYETSVRDGVGGITLEFMERAFEVASHGVAIREAFLQGAASRHRAIRRTRADDQGRWDPEADRATSYAWFVWSRRQKN